MVRFNLEAVRNEIREVNQLERFKEAVQEQVTQHHVAAPNGVDSDQYLSVKVPNKYLNISGDDVMARACVTDNGGGEARHTWYDVTFNIYLGGNPWAIQADQPLPLDSGRNVFDGCG